MSNLKKGLQIYLRLQNSEEDLLELQKECKLNQQELKVVKDFYLERDMLFEVSDDEYAVGYYGGYSTSIIERIKSLDILNVSLMKQYQEITDQMTGPFILSNPTTIIDKRSSQTIQFQTEKETIKKMWIDAIIKHKILKIVTSDGTAIENSEVKPLGLYYPDGSDRQRGVYKKIVKTENSEEVIDEVEFDNIRDCTELKNRRFKPIPFSIKKYLNNKKQQYMLLRVYPQAHVLEKLKKVFIDNLQEESKSDGYVRVKVKTDDPMQYCKLLESYGKSVLVEEPKELQNQILENAKECLTFYEKL